MPLTLFFFLLSFLLSFLPLTRVAFFAVGGGAMREVLLTRWEGRDDQVLLYGLLPAGVDHGELMGRVRFCLCLTGDDEGAAAASRRVVEAITAGYCAVDSAVSFLRRHRR
uniref:Secreted protein n=1 Tax=Oryza barthii TaxID=65489 RepID=A0A0D3HT22_9ORYZ